MEINLTRKDYKLKISVNFSRIIFLKETKIKPITISLISINNINIVKTISSS